MSSTTTQQHNGKIETLFNLGEQRARAAGDFGVVDLNHWLSEDEQKQLSQALQSLPCELSPKPPSGEQ